MKSVLCATVLAVLSVNAYAEANSTGSESATQSAPECSIYPDSFECMRLEDYPDSAEFMDSEDIDEEPEDLETYSE